MSKLIILNGPPGSGKSTVAERLHKEMPMSLSVELDVWRRNISGYKDDPKASLRLAFEHALAAIEVSLKAGHDVIVNRPILDSETLDTLTTLGKKYGAEVFEFMLFANKDTILKRVLERGYIPGSLLTPEKTAELWERSNTFKDERPNAILVDTGTLNPDDAYARVKEVIGM